MHCSPHARLSVATFVCVTHFYLNRPLLRHLTWGVRAANLFASLQQHILFVGRGVQRELKTFRQCASVLMLAFNEPQKTAAWKSSQSQLKAELAKHNSKSRGTPLRLRSTVSGSSSSYLAVFCHPPSRIFIMNESGLALMNSQQSITVCTITLPLAEG